MNCNLDIPEMSLVYTPDMKVGLSLLKNIADTWKDKWCFFYNDKVKNRDEKCKLSVKSGDISFVKHSLYLKTSNTLWNIAYAVYEDPLYHFCEK